MFKKTTLKDILQLVVLVSIAIVVSYLYANNQVRNQLWQKTYPLRAEMSLSNLACTDKAPSWMAYVLKHQAKLGNAPSNQIAYIDKTGELHHCENGYKGQYPWLSDSITPDTRFRYASVTKLWTSDAILELAKSNRISLDDPLAKYINEIQHTKDSRINDITLRQLLLHRGGFDRTSVLGHDMFNIGTAICPDNFEHLNSIKLNFDPDSKMSYSNLGYCLLGEVIARVEGKSYTNAISNKYQLENSNIKFISNNKMSDEVFYNFVQTGLTGVSNIYTEFDYDALASSAGLSGSAIALAEQVKGMISKPTPNIKTFDNDRCNLTKLKDCYGYAMFPYRDTQRSSTVYYRDGGLLGLSSLVAVTDNNEVVVVLSNGTSAQGAKGADEVKMKIYNALK